MTDNTFFNSFLNKKNNKLWRNIQTDPNAYRILWDKKYPSQIPVFLTAGDGTHLNNAIHHNRYLRFYDAPANRHRIRIPAGQSNQIFGLTGDKNFSNQEHIKNYISKFKLKPAMGVALPDPAVGNAGVQIASTMRNVMAYMSSGRYKIGDFNVNNPAWGWRDKSDYWWPNYEGNFNDIAENAVRKQPTKPYDKDASFLAKNFLSNKQKESFMWLVAGNRLYNM